MLVTRGYKGYKHFKLKLSFFFCRIPWMVMGNYTSCFCFLLHSCFVLVFGHCLVITYILLGVTRQHWVSCGYVAMAC